MRRVGSTLKEKAEQSIEGNERSGLTYPLVLFEQRERGRMKDDGDVLSKERFWRNDKAS